MFVLKKRKTKIKIENNLLSEIFVLYIKQKCYVIMLLI
jgi:hypothetical protein